MVILGTYNGKPPSLGKGGFPFSSISCARCHALPLGNQRQENEALALGPSAKSGLFATTPGPRCCGPVQLCDSLRLPSNAGRAGAGAMRCWDFLCEWLDMLAMGPNAMLRLLVNPNQSPGIEAGQQQQQQERSVTPGHALRWKCKEAVRMTLD